MSGDLGRCGQVEPATAVVLNLAMLARSSRRPSSFACRRTWRAESCTSGRRPLPSSKRMIDWAASSFFIRAWAATAVGIKYADGSATCSGRTVFAPSLLFVDAAAGDDLSNSCPRKSRSGIFQGAAGTILGTDLVSAASFRIVAAVGRCRVSRILSSKRCRSGPDRVELFAGRVIGLADAVSHSRAGAAVRERPSGC